MSFGIESDLAPVRIVLLGGTELTGSLFVRRSASRHRREETLGDRLKESGVDFVPLEVGDGRVEMLNVDGVAYLEHPGDLPEVAEMRELEVPAPRVRVVLHSGEALGGELFAFGPPDRDRLSDVLNRSGRFLLLADGERSLYVNRRAVSLVRPAEERRLSAAG